MNTLIKKILVLTGAWLMTLAASAQNYSLDWSTIDGGGGTSSGGTYAVSGTLDQTDASMSGGNYRLEGGFWNIIAALQTPDAPRLAVSATGGVLTVSWPQPAAGWALYTTPTVSGNHRTRPIPSTGSFNCPYRRATVFTDCKSNDTPTETQLRKEQT